MIQCLQNLGQFGISRALAVAPLHFRPHAKVLHALFRHYYQIVFGGQGSIEVHHQHRSQRGAITAQYVLELPEVIEHPLRDIEVLARGDVGESKGVTDAELHGWTLGENALDGRSPSGHAERMFLKLHQPAKQQSASEQKLSIMFR